MSIICESGEVQRIETRATTPFLDTLGAEVSYDEAYGLAGWAFEAVKLEDDYPHREKLDLLAIATVQNAAEVGYISRNIVFSSDRLPRDIGRSLLASLGLTYDQVGAALDLGEDQWNRSSFDERSHLRQLLGSVIEPGVGLPEVATEDEIQFLNSCACISSGVIASLEMAAVAGYVWGNQGVNISLPSIRTSSSLGLSQITTRRSLHEAYLFRQQELALQVIFTQIEAGANYRLAVNS